MSNTVLKNVQAYHSKGSAMTMYYSDSIDHCPYCKHSMSLTPDHATYTLPAHPQYDRKNALFLTYVCRRDNCQKPFIAVYNYRYDPSQHRHKYTHQLSFVIPSLPKNIDWPHEIDEISPSFSEIYNQAVACESHGYNHASGPTYRKSLEFLIKDFAIIENPGKEIEIRAKLLGQCINEFIDNEPTKQCAKRAAWLGNDETHYTRKWENKDISDLKTLIQLTVNHIQTTLLTKKYLDEM
ncbi:PF13643 domain protein [Bacteriovorax sp. BSW11_IV]|uniref:DUF4145 domain-containing protein n=1 Tax=Bacteriovorax sp. BSW11_IV TaxID=1353529 RepID=UPI000389F34D|nr:DUF4145 domain-containing protein [Bacteriovorax sp. BSW11_IV]EQC44967.1 PF13643 domain protein [Bacteriovorax sp. BSW11_IV]